MVNIVLNCKLEMSNKQTKVTDDIINLVLKNELKRMAQELSDKVSGIISERSKLKIYNTYHEVG